MWDLALITIFINHPLYVGFFSSSQYGTGVLHILLAHALYQMSPKELSELQRQLIELLEASFIQPSKALYGTPVLF
jgi:hypothetical protein